MWLVLFRWSVHWLAVPSTEVSFACSLFTDFINTTDFWLVWLMCTLTCRPINTRGICLDWLVYLLICSPINTTDSCLAGLFTVQWLAVLRVSIKVTCWLVCHWLAEEVVLQAKALAAIVTGAVITELLKTFTVLTSPSIHTAACVLSRGGTLSASAIVLAWQWLALIDVGLKKKQKNEFLWKFCAFVCNGLLLLWQILNV